MTHADRFRRYHTEALGLARELVRGLHALESVAEGLHDEPTHGDADMAQAIAEDLAPVLDALYRRGEHDPENVADLSGDPRRLERAKRPLREAAAEFSAALELFDETDLRTRYEADTTWSGSFEDWVEHQRVAP